MPRSRDPAARSPASSAINAEPWILLRAPRAAFAAGWSRRTRRRSLAASRASTHLPRTRQARLRPRRRSPHTGRRRRWSRPPHQPHPLYLSPVAPVAPVAPGRTSVFVVMLNGRDSLPMFLSPFEKICARDIAARRQGANRYGPRSACLIVWLLRSPDFRVARLSVGTIGRVASSGDFEGHLRVVERAEVVRAQLCVGGELAIRDLENNRARRSLPLPSRTELRMNPHCKLLFAMPNTGHLPADAAALSEISTAASRNRYWPGGFNGDVSRIGSAVTAIASTSVLPAQDGFAHIVEHRKANREVELLFHRLGFHSAARISLTLFGAVSRNVYVEAHCTVGVFRAGDRSTCPDHHVAATRNGVRLVYHLPAGAYLHVLAADLHLDRRTLPSRSRSAGLRPAGSVRIFRAAAVRRRSPGSRRRGRATRATAPPVEPYLAQIAGPATSSPRRGSRCTPTTGSNSSTLTLTRASAASAASATTRLRPFEHEALRQHDQPLRSLYVSQVPQQRGKASNDLRRELSNVGRHRLRFLLDIAIAVRQLIGIRVAARAKQQPPREDRVRP